MALATQLGLTESQQRDVRAIFERMNAAAKPLGGELIAQEQALDQLFAKGEIAAKRLADATSAIEDCKDACDRCTSRRTLRPAPCSTRIKSPVISSSAAMAIRRLRRSITIMDRSGDFAAPLRVRHRRDWRDCSVRARASFGLSRGEELALDARRIYPNCHKAPHVLAITPALRF